MEKKGKAAINKTAAKENGEIARDANEEENVDKIRDILFGNQMRDFDRKFAQLEERVGHDIASMRKENANQIETLRAFVESEIEILSSRLLSEETARNEAQDELEEKLKKTVKQFDQKLTELGKSLDQLTRDTNQKIFKQSQEFSGELSSQLEQTRKRMDGYRQDLNLAKMDKSVLAEMLNSMAMQINQEDIGSE